MRPGFPAGSLLAALLGGEAPVEARRAARRLRAEGAPALAADAEIVALADGLAGTGVAHSPAVLDALPPLFWIEAPEEMAGAEMAGAEMAGTEVAGAAPLRGWVVEKRGDGLAARGFSLAVGAEALPEPAGDTALAFGGHPVPEAAAARALRGLAAAVALPEMLAQMGESSPVLLLPAEAPAEDALLLRGLRLSVALARDSAPG
ncbi:hypothetical protein [Teichococcus aestuarii]|uniref:hypothetical protein n=1 Tax=Teichococcus aestuarii TaxID=568898 RepID=UPI00361C0465